MVNTENIQSVQTDRRNKAIDVKSKAEWTLTHGIYSPDLQEFVGIHTASGEFSQSQR